MKKREFNFNTAIRKQIAANMLAAWDNENLRNEWRGVPTVGQLAKRAEWTKHRQQFADTVGMVLSTIKGTAQLRDEWPEALPYLPLALTDPSKGVALPKPTSGPFAAKGE